MTISSDVLVCGGGLAGITAALSAAREGADVRLVSHKRSTLPQASGLIDALGYIPPTGEDATTTPSAKRQAVSTDRPDVEGPLVDPFGAIDRLPADHPYRLVGEDALRAGLSLFDDISEGTYLGDHTDRNALVPTFGGTVKPTARYPLSVAAGLASDQRPMLIVGDRMLTDFDGRYVASRLEAAGVPWPVAGNEIEFASAFRPDATVTRIARALDENQTIAGEPARSALATSIEPHLDAVADGAGRVGLPAYLGVDRSAEVITEVGDLLGVDVFEIPMGAPSLPGLRLADRLYSALDVAGVSYETGVKVVGREPDDESASGGGVRVERALVDRSGREIPYRAKAYVIASGGLIGKGIVTDRDVVREPVFGCHVPHPDDRYDWFVDDVFGDQPYARFGVRADDGLRPLDAAGNVQFANVHVAGAILGGADVAREKSASGVSLATGVVAGREAAREVRS